jgi:hypothetical protein
MPKVINETPVKAWYGSEETRSRRWQTSFAASLAHSSFSLQRNSRQTQKTKRNPRGAAGAGIAGAPKKQVAGTRLLNTPSAKDLAKRRLLPPFISLAPGMDQRELDPRKRT